MKMDEAYVCDFYDVARTQQRGRLTFNETMHGFRSESKKGPSLSGFGFGYLGSVWRVTGLGLSISVWWSCFSHTSTGAGEGQCFLDLRLCLSEVWRVSALVRDKSVFSGPHMKIQMVLFVLRYGWSQWKCCHMAVRALRSLPNWFFGSLDRKYLQVHKQASLTCFYPQFEDRYLFPSVSFGYEKIVILAGLWLRKECVPCRLM
ncbi:hypothetical protein F2Q69_00010049 [Brassica cretica]|uniref:Uncharacterized protein n=1 Tax=Brassica cretica TaxID=69181 RepID=A0A8S9PR30_BRACR|nr:hypothetical protein F2Q69_00010049 [Brassica cretica]